MNKTENKINDSKKTTAIRSFGRLRGCLAIGDESITIQDN